MSFFNILRRPRIAVLVAVLPFAILAPSAFASGNAARTYRDSAGDSGRGPDITNAKVANDKKGVLTFRVTLGNRNATHLDSGDAFALGLDVDGNKRTGSPTGTDVVVESSLQATGSLALAVTVWTGSTYQYSPELAGRLLALARQLRNGYGTHAPYVWDVTVPRGVFGISKALRFWAASSNPAGGEDYLPNDPTTVPYTLTLPKPKKRPARAPLVGGFSVGLDQGVDNVGAPDIVAVRASNDAAGTLTFELFLEGSAVVGDGQAATVFVNADGNNSTGSVSGSEFAIELAKKAGANETYSLYRYTKSGWVFVRNVEGWNAGSIGLRVARALLGVKTSFTFYAGVTSGSQADYAPAARPAGYKLK